MNPAQTNSRRLRIHPVSVLLACLLCCMAVSVSGCHSNTHTSNPRLRQIDELLTAQLPNGTPRQRVSFFLRSRGFEERPSADPSAVVAVVRHVDTDTLQPAAARVTFHFDAQDKLTTYDLETAPDIPLQP